MDELCSTCLSKHRTLVPLSTINILSSTIPFTLSPVLVCWECSSRLQNMQAFIAQATKAQELLKLYLENQKPLKALRNLSRLSLSNTKIDYDENFVYCMKQETVEYEDDFQSEVKFNLQEFSEHIPKVEKIDPDIEESYQSEPNTRVHESYQTESPDVIDNNIQGSLDPSKSLYVALEPASESGDRDGYDSDEWPLSHVTNKKVNCENKSDIKTEPKKYEIEKCDSKLSKKEENFTIKIMSFEELHRLRDEDRKKSRYLSCPFKCTSCITGYHIEDKYNAHLQQKHSKDIGPHACDICLSRHARADQLARHRETHLYRYHCRECPFTSHKHKWMLAHQSEHKAETFRCDICGFSTLKKGKLRYHITNMHKKRLTCQTCGKEFASGSNLTRHMRMKHGAAKREKCAVCGGMYLYIAKHARTHAPPATDAFCVECGVSFKNNNSLRRHLLQHSKHRRQNDVDSLKCYVCDECGRSFTNKTCMERHTASQHTKQYPFNCDICHKGFLRRDRLNNHVLERHEGGQRPRKNVCSYCGKAFKTKEVMTNHIRTHTGERPFKCPLCAWSFAQRVTLRTHMRGKHPGADTGNTGGAGVGGNTDEGGKADASTRL